MSLSSIHKNLVPIVGFCLTTDILIHCSEQISIESSEDWSRGISRIPEDQVRRWHTSILLNHKECQHIQVSRSSHVQYMIWMNLLNQWTASQKNRLTLMPAPHIYINIYRVGLTTLKTTRQHYMKNSRHTYLLDAKNSAGASRNIWCATTSWRSRHRLDSRYDPGVHKDPSQDNAEYNTKLIRSDVHAWMKTITLIWRAWKLKMHIISWSSKLIQHTWRLAADKVEDRNIFF